MAKILSLEGSCLSLDVGDLSPLNQDEVKNYLDDIIIQFRSKTTNTVRTELRKLLLYLKERQNQVLGKHRQIKEKKTGKVEKELYVPENIALTVWSSRTTRSTTGSLHNKSASELLGLDRGSDNELEESTDEVEDKNPAVSKTVLVTDAGPVKRKRGRPRKHPLPANTDYNADGKSVLDMQCVTEEPEEKRLKIGQTDEREEAAEPKIDVAEMKEGQVVMVIQTEHGTAVLPVVDGGTASSLTDTAASKTLVEQTDDLMPSKSDENLTSRDTKKSDQNSTNPETKKLENSTRQVQQKPKKSKHHSAFKLKRGRRKTILPRSMRKKCPHCTKRYFDNKTELSFHIQCHARCDGEIIKNKFTCKYCPKNFDNWNELVVHMVAHRDHRDEMKDMSFTEHVVGCFKCEECDKEFDLKTNLLGHQTRVHKGNNAKCDVCGMELGKLDYKTVRRHLDKCRNIELNCEHCPYKTTVSEDFRTHMRVHTGKGTPCPECEVIFPNKVRMLLHLKSHMPKRERVVCEYCGSDFMCRTTLQQHITRFHKEGVQVINCDLCDFTTKLEKDLQRHMKNVHNKKHKCSQCPYQTNSEPTFQTHLTFHAPDRNHPCTVKNCYYRATSASLLKQHVTTMHQTSTKHTCPICGKEFFRKTHFMRHVVLHSGIKAYECLECHVKFSNHTTYYRHRRKTGHDANRKGLTSVPTGFTIELVSADDSNHANFTQNEDGINEPPPVASTAPSGGEGNELPPVCYVRVDDEGNPVEYMYNISGESSKFEVKGDQDLQQALEALTASFENENTKEQPSTQISHQREEPEGVVLIEENNTSQNQGQHVLVETSSGLQHVSMETTQPVSSVSMETAQEVLSGLQGESVVVSSHQEMPVGGSTVVSDVQQYILQGEGDNGNEIILVMPPGSEPEAALSMLQLQNSGQ